jgi:DNA-binding NarL/FixJ family response regulator
MGIREEPSMPVTVVLACAPEPRRELRELLTATGIAVVAEVGSVAEAERAVRRYRPDVLVLAGLPFWLAVPGAPTLALLGRHDDDALLTAIKAGCRGFLVVDVIADDLGRAVRSLASGSMVFGADVADRVTRWLTGPPLPADPVLSVRERQFLDLLASGLSDAAIAVRLGLAVKTVRNYRSLANRRLGVLGRTEAITRPARVAG